MHLWKDASERHNDLWLLSDLLSIRLKYLATILTLFGNFQFIYVNNSDVLSVVGYSKHPSE